MKIALVVERFLLRGGGVESAAWYAAHALARAGYQTHVLAREFAGETANEPVPHEGIALHRLRALHFWQPIRVISFSRAATLHARAARPRFDIVHSFSRTRHQHVYRAGGGSHAASMRPTYGALGQALRQFSPRHRTLLSIEARVFADDTQLIQCVSKKVCDEIARRHGVPSERLAIIYNGVDHTRFDRRRHATEAAALRRRWGQGADGIWLFAGSGARRKGLDTAIHALAYSRQKAARLWVAGRDAPRPWRALAGHLGVADRVDFLGARKDMPALYAAADLLLLPTRYDPFANVCLEAAASGLPVVTTAANGAAELLAEAGRVVADAGDARALAVALDTLSSRERRRQLGARGRAIARAHDWDAHAKALGELYRRATERRRAALRNGAPP